MKKNIILYFLFALPIFIKGQSFSCNDFKFNHSVVTDSVLNTEIVDSVYFSYRIVIRDSKKITDEFNRIQICFTHCSDSLITDAEVNYGLRRRDDNSLFLIKRCTNDTLNLQNRGGEIVGSFSLKEYKLPEITVADFVGEYIMYMHPTIKMYYKDKPLSYKEYVNYRDSYKSNKTDCLTRVQSFCK